MRSSRYLVLAIALAAAIATQGCNRDYKAPKPKTGWSEIALAVTAIRQ